MHATSTLCRLLLCTVAMALVGCGSTPPAHFYTLNPLPPQTTPATSELAILVGPISVAQYLDRPQMARRISAQELDFDEYHRWAEPIDAALARILVQDLAALLGSQHVVQFPERGQKAFDYRLFVQATRFEENGQGAAIFEARWTLISEAAPAEAATRVFQSVRPLARAGSAGALAAALDEAVAEFAHQIAAQIAPAR